jgi:hypothetical protein
MLKYARSRNKSDLKRLRNHLIARATEEGGEVSNWRRVAAHYARVYHLPTKYFLRQIKQESGFNPNARSPAGALGIAQIMPGTARGWGVNPMNPRQALKAAAHNMARYVRRYGNYRNALIAYNAGPGRVGHSLPAETRKYIAAILGGGSGGGLTRGGGGGGGAKHFGNVNSTVGGDRLSKLIKVMEGFNNPSKPYVYRRRLRSGHRPDTVGFDHSVVRHVWYARQPWRPRSDGP